MARVLIVEDEPAIAMILSEVLRDHGHEPTVALTGVAALENLGQAPTPDVVMLDLFMPGLGGRAVLATMRADTKLRSVPVILVTGAVPSVADFPPEGTYQAFLGKPFDLADVIAAVESCLGSGPRREGERGAKKQEGEPD